MDGSGRKILAWFQAMSPWDVRTHGEQEDRSVTGFVCVRSLELPGNKVTQALRYTPLG